MEKSVICLFYVGFEVICFVTLFVFFSLFLDPYTRGHRLNLENLSCWMQGSIV
jgi:hypothetical protein